MMELHYVAVAVRKYKPHLYQSCHFPLFIVPWDKLKVYKVTINTHGDIDSVHSYQISGCIFQALITSLQAIECGNVKNFCRSLDDMRKFFAKYPPSPLSEGHLDVCIRQQVVISKHTRMRCFHFMSLLAAAVLYNQKEMVDILIERKACKLNNFVYT